MDERTEVDALVARNRLLAELAGVAELDLAQSLWRAAKRFNLKAREERLTGLEKVGQALPMRAGALGGARELEAW